MDWLWADGELMRTNCREILAVMAPVTENFAAGLDNSRITVLLSSIRINFNSDKGLATEQH